MTTFPLPGITDPTVALRVHLLRIATDIAPRTHGGAKAEEIVARAEELEQYVLRSPAGSASFDASDAANPERGAPDPKAPDAGPADLRDVRPEIGGERQQPSA